MVGIVREMFQEMPVFTTAMLALIAFCLFGLVMSVRQGIDYGNFADRCREAGGVYYHARHATPVCLSPEAFVRVPLP